MSILNSIIKIFVGDKAKKDLKQVLPLVEKIKSFKSTFSNLSNDELRETTNRFKKQIQDSYSDLSQKIDNLLKEVENISEILEEEEIYQEIDQLKNEIYQRTESELDSLLPEAFAVMKETAKRFTENEKIQVTASAFDRELSATKDYVSLNGDNSEWENHWDASGVSVIWNMIHYDVQLIGGIALHQGKIAEMQTGEGKTLVATLPLYLNALTGKGTHLITVNDYLAKRDSAWMAPLFEFHGLSVDCIDKYDPNTKERKKAYSADITYGTNNEFGFDYLRDNMAHSQEEIVQRKLNFCIVDEVDSVLIDDARTPLIISGPVPEGNKHEFHELKPLISDLVAKQRIYLTQVLKDAKKNISSENTKEGGKLLLQVYRGLPKNKNLIKYLSEEGIRQILQKTENFHMQDNNKEMPNIDKHLFFVIDEKNNQIELSEKGIEQLSVNYDQNFFVLPDIGTEIAKIEKVNYDKDTELKEKETLFTDFSIKSERVHSMNQLLKAYTLFEKDVEYVVMNDRVMIVDEQTGRIMEGRRYSDGLHQAIEAKENLKIEAATQTFATITLQNYFRMYAKLSGMTGTAITESGEFWEIYKLDVMEIPTNKPIARKDFNDYIYKTKKEKYNAIINQTEKYRANKRAILIGTTSVEISELLSKMLNLRKISHNVLNAKLHKKEADVVAEAGQSGMVTIATNMAGRGTDIKLTKEVKNQGGLSIIGTERHDSRRIDRQLRGRSGRQGDPGSSEFYVSLEDNLMRLFGSERISKIMDRMGLKEGEVIQHSMMTKSIERAQRKVEENNFGIRKRLLEYDDIMNSQREIIYRRRFNALEGTKLSIDISNMIYDACEYIVQKTKPVNDFKDFEFELIKSFSTSSSFNKTEFQKLAELEIISKLYKEIYNLYKEKNSQNIEQAFPIIKRVYETQKNKFERIVVPFSDGIKTLNVVTNLENAYKSKGEKLIADFEKNISLAIIDESWKTHLRKMDELKQSVQLAVHEQKDPLLIYKFEAFELFKEVLYNVNKDIISFLFKCQLPINDPNEIHEAKNIRAKNKKLKLIKENLPNMDELSKTNQKAIQSSGKQQAVETIVRKDPKIGRNDKVFVINTNTGEKKELKYKQAKNLIENGDWVLTND